MSAERGIKAILAALVANLGIALAKLVGFIFTGSSSMLAESVHSLADTGNQALLLVGRRGSKREADLAHPFGYGRDRYFYAFIVALVIFTLGAVFAGYEGVHKLEHPTDVESPAVALGILLVAVALESFSFRTAIHEARHTKNGESWVAYIRRAKAPELPVVMLEDFGALIGLVFALCGVALATITGNGRWDAAGALAISALLGTIAVVLMIETKSLLIGESASPEAVTRIRAALTGAGIDRVIHLKTLHLGPEELLVAAKVAMPAKADLDSVAHAIDAAERRVRAVEPQARLIYLEPDLERSGTRASPPSLSDPSASKPAT